METVKSTSFKLSDENILIGTDDEPNAELLNVLLIDVKVDIYLARKTGNPPNINRIINKFTNRCKTEEIIARKNSTTHQHKVKWSPILKSQESP